MRRRGVLAGALLCVWLAQAAPAVAGTAHVVTTEFQAMVVYTAAAGERNDVTIRADTATVAIHDEAGVTPGPGCVQAIPADGRGAFCDPPEDITVVRAALGDGDDRVRTESGETPVVLRGGPGDDMLAADDAEFDVIDGGRGADDMDGGRGIGDTVSYRSRTAPVVADLDGNRDDGELGEGDRIAGAEALVGGAGPDTLTGDRGMNELAGGAGRDVLRGGAGADTLLGGAGRDRLGGGEGSDELSGGRGTDLLIGGPDDARDALAGGAGHDVLRGGRGSDVYLGGRGDDNVDARDGGFDAVACGPGADIARLDGVDLVSGCRIRRRAQPAVPLLDGVAAAGARRVVVAIACAVDMPSRCRGHLRVSLGGRVVVARDFLVERGRVRTMRLRLGRRAVRRLARRGSVIATTRDARGRAIRVRDSLASSYLIDVR